ncbi:MAG TPA: RHS repeat-associated core domain-containing protein [Chryseosolibacter sp.]
MSTLFSALSAAFNFNVPSGSGLESVAAKNKFQAMYGSGSFVGTGDPEAGGAPKAFINYILFDEGFNMLEFGFDQVDASGAQNISGPVVPHDQVAVHINVQKKGYLYIFVSNENPTKVEVYFDDVTITHTPTNIVQYNEYYPYGLSASTSWTRTGNNNDFLYNAGSELNKVSGWYDLPFRNYDAALGRFMQVDPMSVSEMATYQYAGNNPVLFNDPMGLYRKDNAQIARNTHDTFLNRVSGSATEWAIDGSSHGPSGRTYLPGMRTNEEIAESNAKIEQRREFFTAIESALRKAKETEYNPDSGCPPGMKCEFNSKGELVSMKDARTGVSIPLKGNSNQGYWEGVRHRFAATFGEEAWFAEELAELYNPDGSPIISAGTADLPVGPLKAVKWLASFKNAQTSIKQVGNFWRATAKVQGRGGSYTIYTKMVNNSGRTVKWFHDTFDKTGKFLHRGWTVGSTKIHQWWDGFIKIGPNAGPHIPR